MAISSKNIEKIVSVYRPIALRLDEEHKHVSVIMKGGIILSVGYNSKKTHPMADRYGYFDASRHSELDALRQIQKRRGPISDLRLSHLTLLNLRFNNRGELRMSKPCSKCLPWCTEIFKTIYYSCNDGTVIKMEKI